MLGQNLAIQQLNNIQIYYEPIISEEITCFIYFTSNKTFVQTIRKSTLVTKIFHRCFRNLLTLKMK